MNYTRSLLSHFGRRKTKKGKEKDEKRAMRGFWILNLDLQLHKFFKLLNWMIDLGFLVLSSKNRYPKFLVA